MKTLTILTILFLSFSSVYTHDIENINVNATSGSSGIKYSTLKAAIDAINAGTHRGDITIQVLDSTSESSAITLSASGGSASYTSILIYPTVENLMMGGTVSGNLFSFNGADNVTIDGRVNQTGAANLTISNYSTSSSASTFNFYNDAQNNTIKYTYVRGSSTNTSGGVIYFGSGSVSGNDNNTIDNCYIREIGSNKPRFLIYSAGTNSKENSGNTISNNNIFCFGGGTTNAGIYLYSYTTTWVITGNSFYQDDLISGSSATSYGININTGNGYVVSGNYVGGSAPLCGGTPWTVTGTPTYCNLYAIYLNVGTVSASSVQGNTVKNFSWQSTNTGSHWIGIYISAGSVNAGNVSGNVIGSSTGTGSITIYNGGNYGNAIGIYSTSTGTVNISNNSIGSFTFSASSYTAGFTGIKVTPSNSSGTTTISSNLIGSLTTSSSIYSATAGQSLVGIMSYGFSATGTLNITNNTIANLHSNAGGSNDQSFGMFLSSVGTCTVSGNTIRDIYNNSKYSAGNNYGTIGIQMDDAQMYTITQNNIYNLYNISTSAYNTGVLGIYNCATSAAGASQFTRNRIYNLYNASTGSSAAIYGINCLYSGAADYVNNQISLGTGVLGTLYIYGIMLYDSGPVKFYYNSIYLGGTATAGNSIAFQRYIWTASYYTYIKNNILYNGRSGGTGTHYAIASTNSTPTVAMPSGYSNYNLFITPNSNYAALWWYSSVSFATWKSNSSSDANSWYVVSSSISAADLFTDAANGDLTVRSNNSAAWYLSGKGLPLTGYCDDFVSGGCRSITVSGGATDIGSNEFAATELPITASVSGSHSLNGTETFSFGSRTVCTINWGSTGSLPTINYVKYHIGKNPTCSEGNYSNGYWEINTSGGSGFSYTLNLYYDPNMIGTITSESNIRIAKSEDNSTWVHHEGSVVNTSTKIATVAGLTSFSYFALSDLSYPMPVVLNFFRNSISNNSVILEWETSSEINNAGFTIERKNRKYSVWVNAGFVQGKGSSDKPVQYSFTDKKLTAGFYEYRLKQTDYNGNYEYFSLSEAVNIKNPDVFSMSQNYPNPSNPLSKIDYLIPENGIVIIKVYDMLGKEVAVLVNEYKDAGYYTAEFNGSELSSGIYYYRLSSGSYNETKKMVLVK